MHTTPEPTFGRYWRENFRRSIRDWDRREVVSGLLVIVLTAAGYGIVTEDPQVTKFTGFVALVYVAFLFLFQSPWQMWRDSQRQIVGYEEALTPRLKFVFEPEVPPYLQHLHLADGRTVRLYRIGIRNESAAIIKKVRVVIEAAEHTLNETVVPRRPDQPVLMEHALNVMGIDSKDGRVDLSPGERPTAYFDVVQQVLPDNAAPEEYMSPCYATGHQLNVLITRSRWLFRLRVEGARTYRIAKVSIEQGTDGRIVMTPYSFD